MQPVILNDFRAMWEQVRSDALDAVDAVGRSGWLVLGKEVAEFERALAEWFALPHAVGCASGLDALEMGLRILGLRPGERVLTTPLSAFATTLAIIRAGGSPVFVDVDETGLVDLDATEEILSRGGERIRFFVPVHLYGHALNLKKLARLREKFDLTIIEDCAQAIGAKSGNASIGSVGQLSALSLYPTKNLGCLGDGGAILTPSAEYAASARSLRDYGQSTKYVHDEIGFNSRLDELQAAILNRAILPRLGDFTDRRREIAAQFKAGIRNPSVEVPPAPADSNSVWHLFPVLVSAQSREAFQTFLRERGVQSGVHYPQIIPVQRAMALAKHEIVGELSNARRFAACEVSLPIHPYLTDAEITRVIEAVNSWRAP